jgi:hypothetical protein
MRRDYPKIVGAAPGPVLLADARYRAQAAARWTMTAAAAAMSCSDAHSRAEW